MTPLEFIAFWHAQPFRPFRLVLGRGSFEVLQQAQLAMSPDLQRAVLMLADRAEAFTVEEVQRCEWLAGAVAPEVAAGGVSGEGAAEVPPGAIGEYRPDPGEVTTLAFADTEGHRLVHANVTDASGSGCFSTAGTRWDFHGLERFENGCSLFLHHLDDPTTEQRVIIWPASNGTFESFAEAMPFPALQEELERRDRALRSKPRDPEAPGGYDGAISLRSRRSPRHISLERDGEPDPATRYVIDTDQLEVGPNHWASALKVTDTWTHDVVLDLLGSGWDLSAASGLPPWTVAARCFPRGDRSFKLKIAPDAGVGWIDRAPTAWPLPFIERQMHNFLAYRQLDEDEAAEGWDWATLMAVLAAGPTREPGKAELVRSLPGGFVLEFWPGPPDAPTPFLHPRVVSPAGRTLIDFRGSQWGALVEWSGERPELRLVPLSADPRADKRSLGQHLVLGLASRRVTSNSYLGATSIGVLHRIVQQTRDVDWMEQELVEAFGRGRYVPLP